MTINLADNTPRISYTVAQGVTQTSFAVPFEFFDNGDLKVYVDGTLKTITTHYTVSGGDGSTGTVAISVTGITGGSTVVITRDIPLARTTDFPTSGAFAVATLNRELDRFTAMQADRADESDRSIRLKDQDSTSSMELPLLADRKGKYLRFASSDGDIEPTDQAVDTGGITTSLLADSAVTTAKINASAVTAAKINAAAVTTAKIADTAVTGAKINTDAISAQTALTSGLAATDELLVSDAGTIKRMDVSVVTDYYKDLSVTETNKTLTSAVLNSTISGTSIKDEDDMSSNSASHLATQQSIKAYVDATVTAEDLDLTTDSGTIAIDLDSETLTIAGGEGIDTSATSNTVTITAEAATASNLGVASFSSDNFDVSSGAVTIKDGGVVTAELAADAVTGAKIADNAINSEHYTDGSIDTAHIADAQVTTAKIAADAITSAKIADDAISEEHLDPSVISGLADTTIASADHLMFLDATDGALKKVDAGELGVGSALTEIVGDTSPQLGGNLDVNGNEITSASNGNIVVNPNGTGDISLSADVGVGTASPAGQLHISGDDVSNQVIIENTSADANNAPDLLLKRNSASPADDDEVGQIVFQGRNDNSQFPTLATMKVIYKDVTDTTEDAALVYELMTAGTRSEVMRLEGGNVGVNESAPTVPLEVKGAQGYASSASNLLTSTTKAAAKIRGSSDASTSLFFGSLTNDAEQYIQSANGAGSAADDLALNPFGGNVGIGLTAPVRQFHVHESSGSSNAYIHMTSAATGTTTTDGFSVLVTGNTGQAIINQREAQPLAFRTSNTERMRIDSSGDLFVSKTSQNLDAVGVELRATGVTVLTADNGIPLFLNRQSTDGDMIRFYQAGNLEGSISVTGTTVELNGAHLTRWAQLSDGSKDTSILRGTVMTNLDQMAVWSHDAVAATYYVDGDDLPEITPATYYTEDDTLPDGVSVGDEKTSAVYAKIGDEKTPAKDAYTEDNEQLNCVAVSSVEGDSNVAGVLSSWDNDDEQFNDMKIGMTGDMVIRIAQGTTVARGDLLMSAGDGTAKSQGDDIVRSKTIAKVTSTHVSHTYDDGSYLVPCVLMAC